MPRSLRSVKTIQYTIATIVFGGLALLLLPLVTGKSPVKSSPESVPAAVEQAVSSPTTQKAAPPAVTAQPVVLTQNPQTPKPAATEPPPAPSKPAKAPKTALTKEQKNRKTADAFFAGPVVQLEFTFKPEEWENIKKDNRRYTECEMDVIDPSGKKTRFKGVGVKLKGAAGSFRGPDDKPGITVTFDKFKGAERCYGMEKFHLNNGAQDGSLLNEYIGGEMSRAAGVPAEGSVHKGLSLLLLREARRRALRRAFHRGD